MLNDPRISIPLVVSVGATDLQKSIPIDVLPRILIAYNSALQRVFILAIPLAGLGFFAGLAMEWKSLKGKDPQQEPEAATPPMEG